LKTLKNQYKSDKNNNEIRKNLLNPNKKKIPENSSNESKENEANLNL
jgi:hypothetical protein